jgi:hypothetical protein
MEIPYILLIFLTYPLEFPQICFKIWTLPWKFLHFWFTFAGGHWKFHMSSIGGVRINNVISHWNTQLYTNEKLSDLYKDIPIATQCGLLSAHIIKLSAVTCNNMSTDFCKRYMTVHKNIWIWIYGFGFMDLDLLK